MRPKTDRDAVPPGLSSLYTRTWDYPEGVAPVSGDGAKPSICTYAPIRRNAARVRENMPASGLLGIRRGITVLFVAGLLGLDKGERAGAAEDSMSPLAGGGAR
jgi:hypothetical protein